MIIDDESRAMNLLRMTVEQSFPGQFLIETAQSGEEGLSKLSSFKPELLFLDIEMPSMSGFDILAASRNAQFKVIFTTAHNEYAIKAIRYNALDYLLKPIDIAELQDAIGRFDRQKNAHTSVYKKQLENFLSNREKTIAITTYEGVVLLEVDNIIRCEANLNYTNFILSEGRNFLSSRTLKEYEDLLEGNGNFIRVHRSHLINIHWVAKFKNDGMLVLKDGSEVPVSRRRKEEVMQKLHARPRAVKH